LQDVVELLSSGQGNVGIIGRGSLFFGRRSLSMNGDCNGEVFISTSMPMTMFDFVVFVCLFVTE